jgi:putative flippase GtrA
MQPLKYLFAAIGYGVFLLLVTLSPIDPAYANAIGYGAALCAAYFLNKTFIFNESRTSHSTAPKFIIAFAISFTLNQLVLFIAYRWIGISAGIAQLFAMSSYTVVFYLLNKKFVFNTFGEPSTSNKK